MSTPVTCLGVVLKETVQGLEWRGPVMGQVHVVVQRDTEIRTRWYAYAHLGEPLDRLHARIGHSPQDAADRVGFVLLRGSVRLLREALRVGGGS